MSKLINVPYNFNPRGYQLEVFKALDGIKGKPETKIKRVLLRWHRRAGKDKACWAYLVKEAATVVGNYFYVFPFASDARRALWENVDRDGFRLVEHLPSELVERKNNQDMLIQLTNGSTIRVIGLDNNPEGIRGTSVKGIVFSEFAFSDPSAYRNVLPSLKEASGWSIINSTPAGRNHFYEMDVLAQKSDNWYHSVLQTYWPDRPNYSGLVSPENLRLYIEEEGATEEDAEREYGVSFSTGAKGAVYADAIEKARSQGRVGFFPYKDHLTVQTFWDLGISDSTAIWFVQYDGDRITFIDYHEDSNKSIAEYAQVLSSKPYRYGTHHLPHDGKHRTVQTGLTTVEILEDCCRSERISADVYVDRAPSKLIDGINTVRSRFSRFYFNEETTFDALEKLNLYHYKFDKVRQVFLKQPVHDWTSHCADALRTEATAQLDHELIGSQYKLPKVNYDYDIYDC